MFTFADDSVQIGCLGSLIDCHFFNFKNLFIMLITLSLAILAYFFLCKRYYIRFNSVEGVSEESLIKVFKYEFGLSLAQIKVLTAHMPYVLKAGTFFETRSLMKQLTAMGFQCERVRALKGVEEGPVTPVEPPVAPVGDNFNTEAWKYADEAFSLALRPVELKKDKKVKEEEEVKEDETQMMEYAMTSPEEAMRVDALIDQAEAAADAPYDEAFRGRISTLRKAVSWTLKRHWTHSWILIVGVLVTLFVLFVRSLSTRTNVREAKEVVAKVKKWERCDTTFAEYPGERHVSVAAPFDNAVDYKMHHLCKSYNNHLRSKSIAERKAKEAKETTSRSERKELLEEAKEHERDAKEYLKEYKKWNKMNFRQVRAAAIEEAEHWVNHARSIVTYLFIYVLILMPLYVMASHQYGYVITKTKESAKMLNELRNLGYELALSVLGLSLMVKFAPDYVVTEYRNGRVDRKYEEMNEENYFNWGKVMAIVVVAFIIMCVVSVVVMTISTIIGLYHNYDWKQIIGTMKAKVEQVQAK